MRLNEIIMLNSIALAYEIGEYFNDLKIGTWKSIYHNKSMYLLYIKP